MFCCFSSITSSPLAGIRTFGQWQLWRLFTQVLIDPSPRTMLCSMVGLFFFGPSIEAKMGRTKFLLYYLLSGILSAPLASIVTPALLGVPGVTWGAFGPLMALVIAAGLLMPTQAVMFMFVIPMTMRNLMFLSILVDAAFAVSGALIAVNALCAAVVAFLLLRTNLLSTMTDRVERWNAPSIPSSIRLPNVAAVFTPKPVSEDELDRLLEKVHQHGIGSLTNSEKAALKRASKQRRQQ